MIDVRKNNFLARRSLLGRSHHHSISPVPSSNTLTVQVPHFPASNQGQSLPNLLSIAVPVPVNLASAAQPAQGSGRINSYSFCCVSALSFSVNQWTLVMVSNLMYSPAYNVLSILIEKKRISF